jgi:hypothetical protein
MTRALPLLVALLLCTAEAASTTIKHVCAACLRSGKIETIGLAGDGA